MALDIAKALHDQAWTLLEADADFPDSVKPGNRLKQTDKEYQAKADLKRQPADYPCCSIRVTGESLNDPASQTPQTFGMNASSYTSSTGDYGVPGTLTLSVKLIYDKMCLTTTSPIESYVKRALLSAGPRFGLNSYVSGFRLTMKRADKTTEETGYVVRTVAEYTLVFNVRPKLSTLTGA